MKHILSILLCCIVFTLSSQDQVLDQLINKSVFGKPALIFLKHKVVSSDSTAVKRIEHFKKDSLVRIKFRNNRTLHVPKDQFWGLITDYNERRRFYKEETYIVWRTTAPYIYKNMKYRNDNMYYFSESLTGEIYPLLAPNIEPVLSDKAQQDILKKFIADHKIGQKQEYHYEPDGPSSKLESGAFISLVSEIIYIFVGDKNHSIEEQKQKIQNEYKSQLPEYPR